jgi:hypothetical protein
MDMSVPPPPSIRLNGLVCPSPTAPTPTSPFGLGAEVEGQVHLDVGVQVEEKTSPFRCRGGGGGKDKAHLGVGVDVEGQTCPFKRRGGGVARGTDKTI